MRDVLGLDLIFGLNEKVVAKTVVGQSFLCPRAPKGQLGVNGDAFGSFWLGRHSLGPLTIWE